MNSDMTQTAVVVAVIALAVIFFVVMVVKIIISSFKNEQEQENLQRSCDERRDDIIRLQKVQAEREIENNRIKQERLQNKSHWSRRNKRYYTREEMFGFDLNMLLFLGFYLDDVLEVLGNEYPYYDEYMNNQLAWNERTYEWNEQMPEPGTDEFNQLQQDKFDEVNARLEKNENINTLDELYRESEKVAEEFHTEEKDNIDMYTNDGGAGSNNSEKENYIVIDGAEGKSSEEFIQHSDTSGSIGFFDEKKESSSFDSNFLNEEDTNKSSYDSDSSYDSGGSD